jgi:hypothetical protein
VPEAERRLLASENRRVGACGRDGVLDVAAPVVEVDDSSQLPNGGHCFSGMGGVAEVHGLVEHNGEVAVLLPADGGDGFALWWCSTAWRDGKRTQFGAEGVEATVTMLASRGEHGGGSAVRSRGR